MSEIVEAEVHQSGPIASILPRRAPRLPRLVIAATLGDYRGLETQTGGLRSCSFHKLWITLPLVKPTAFLATLVILISVSIVATPPQATRFELFAMDLTCSCVRTAKETKTVIASETESGKSIYQVFKPTGGGPELFRASIGLIFDTERVKLWNYGVVDERD